MFLYFYWTTFTLLNINKKHDKMILRFLNPVWMSWPCCPLRQNPKQEYSPRIIFLCTQSYSRILGPSCDVPCAEITRGIAQRCKPPTRGPSAVTI